MSTFSVTTPATEISLLTLAELRAAVGSSDPISDADLLTLGRSASSSIARQCCTVDDAVNPPTLLSETCTEIFRWTGCGPIRLSRRPVTEIISVTQSGAVADPSAYEVVSARNLYAVSGDDLSDWAAGRITVVYKAGYATAQGDLKMACMKLVTALNAERGRDPSLKREDIPGVLEREFWVAPSDDPFLSREIADLLTPYAEIWI